MCKSSCFVNHISLSIWSTSFHDVLGSETDNCTSHYMYISLLYCTYQLTKKHKYFIYERVFSGQEVSYCYWHIYALHWYWGSVTFKGVMAVILCYFTKVGDISNTSGREKSVILLNKAGPTSQQSQFFPLNNLLNRRLGVSMHPWLRPWELHQPRTIFICLSAELFWDVILVCNLNSMSVCNCCVNCWY